MNKMDKAYEHEANEIEQSFDISELEVMISEELEASFSELELLEKEREMIANPDSLGKVITDEVLDQLSNQIGLDLTDETLIKKYDRKNFENYDEIKNQLLRNPNYLEKKDLYKQQQMEGTLHDAYTENRLKPGEDVDVEHIVSRYETFHNARRKQANLSVDELVNIDENLAPVNSSLNRSKGADSVKEYLSKREEREKSLRKQNERAKKKIDRSNKPEVDKRLEKNKADKRLQDKLDAKDDLMLDRDRNSRKAQNKKVLKGATIEVSKKAGIDALKMMASQGMVMFLKEVVLGLVRFFKEKQKSFKQFLAEFQQSLKRFLSNMAKLVQSGTSMVVGTIISEIMGPITLLFRRFSSLIKQGVASTMDAIRYLRDKKNKHKPLSVKLAQIGKIVSVGLMGGSAIMLSEVFEKVLSAVPGMQLPIPLLGTLAHIVGLFLASLIAGIFGAVILNLIDRFIAKRLKNESDKCIHHSKNDILALQRKEQYIAGEVVISKREQSFASIKENHRRAEQEMKQILSNIVETNDEREIKRTRDPEIKRQLDNIQKDLEQLL